MRQLVADDGRERRIIHVRKGNQHARTKNAREHRPVHDGAHINLGRAPQVHLTRHLKQRLPVALRRSSLPSSDAPEKTRVPRRFKQRDKNRPRKPDKKQHFIQICRPRRKRVDRLICPNRNGCFRCFIRRIHRQTNCLRSRLRHGHTHGSRLHFGLPKREKRQKHDQKRRADRPRAVTFSQRRRKNQ